MGKKYVYCVLCGGIIILICIILLFIKPLDFSTKASFFPEDLESGIIELSEITNFEWDEVYIFRRPLNNFYPIPDFQSLYEFDPNFQLDDNWSILIFCFNNQIKGYIIYPSYGPKHSVFLYEDGITAIEYLSIKKENAIFSVTVQEDGITWLLKERGQTNT